MIQKVADILFLINVINKSGLLNYKVNGQWNSFSGKDFYQYCFQLAGYLHQHGIKKGDTILLMSENRPEWNFVDYGCQLIGAVTVPVYPTISERELNFIIQQTQPKLAFISQQNLFQKYRSVLEQHFQNKLISFAEIHSVKNFYSELQSISLSQTEEKIKNIYRSIVPNDVLTILYTSGTSGQPKGVMLSHANLVSNVLNCQYIAPFQAHWKALSFLPLNHIYERMVNTLLIYKSVSIYYVEAVEKVVETIQEIKPHLFVSVPRLIERVYQKIIATCEDMKGYKKHILAWSIALAENYELQGKNGWWYELQRTIADTLVYKKWREALGGNLQCMISGGAALNPKMERLFLCAKINCMQGYGLTETSPVVAVNTFDESGKCIGTVGPVIPNTQVKIAEDGEILVKGPGVMMGYYKDENATKEVIDTDGWLHTGDIGEFVQGRFLKITDRKKELFKTMAGKYISPAYIENKLKEHPFIEHCIVIGANEKFPSALIVLHAQNIYRKYPDKKHKNIQQLARDENIQKDIHTFILKINRELAPYEQIRNPQILENTWSVETGELTPKMSLKRKFITEKYKPIIDKVYRKETVE